MSLVDVKGLTKAQRELLRDIGVRDEIVHSSYSPACRLVALGLAAWRVQRLGEPYISITEAGRALLQTELNKEDR